MKKDNLTPEELKTLIYHSLASELGKIQGDISDYDIKKMIFKIIKNTTNYNVEWGEPDRDGKNRIILTNNNKIQRMDTNPFIQAIRILHRDFIEED
jgi:hypothetical protein